MDSVRCLFDAYEPKRKQVFRFGNVNVEIASAIDSDPEALQSGIYLWPASRSICEWLSANTIPDLPDRPLKVIELGSGAGLAGIVTAKFFPESRLILSDRDRVSVDLLQENLEANGIEDGIAVQLSWGDSELACEQLSKLLSQEKSVDLIIGSDLIYSSEACRSLLKTVDHLLHCRQQCFVLCSSFRHPDTTQIVLDCCALYGIERVVETDTIARGGTIVERFFKTID